MIEGKVAYRDEIAGGGFRAHNNRTVAAVRAQVGMVFQHFNLFPHLTVIGNIMEAPVHVLRRSKEEARRRGMELLEQVGLAEKADAFRRNCPVVSSSARRSPARSPWIRRRCCSTKRPARSIPN